MAVYEGRWGFRDHEHPRCGAFGDTRVNAASDNLAKIAIREAGVRSVYGKLVSGVDGFVVTKVKRKGRGRTWHRVR